MVASNHLSTLLRSDVGRRQTRRAVQRFDHRQLVHAATLTAQPPNRPTAQPPAAMYAELHCHSAFSFLDGASPPDELLAEAHRLGYPPLALTPLTRRYD